MSGYVDINLSDDDIKAYIAEARIVQAKTYPQCDCDDDKRVAKVWKEEAARNTCGFIKNQFGKQPENLNSNEREKLRVSCKPFLPKKHNEMLKARGRKTREFWYEFCHEGLHESESVLKDTDVLLVLRKFFPRDFKTIKKLADIKLSVHQRTVLMQNKMFLSRLTDKTRERLGLVRRKKMVTKKDFANSSMTVPQQEDMLLKFWNRKAPGFAHRDSSTGRLIVNNNPRSAWRWLASNYGTALSQQFVDKYSHELSKKKSGRKKRVFLEGDAPAVLTKKTEEARKKLKKKRKQVGDDLEDLMDDDNDFVDSDISDDLDIEKAERKASVERTGKPQSVKQISNDQELQTFINALMHKYDTSYPFSMPMTRWSNPEWALVDANRERIAPALIDKYNDKLAKSRAVLNMKSGGAYASIRDNRQLATAHVMTSWLCGDL